MLCVTNGRLQLLVGYTTPAIKMLIKHQNIKIISEFNIGIIRRGVQLKSLWHVCGLHLHIMGQMVGYVLCFGFLSSTLFFRKKNDTRNFDAFKFIIHLKIRNIVTFGRLQIVWQASMKVYLGCFVLRKPFNFKTV